MTDTDAQAPVVARTELGLDVAQTVVPGVPAAELELDIAGIEIKLVMRDQNRFLRDVVELCDCRDALAR